MPSEKLPGLKELPCPLRSQLLCQAIGQLIYARLVFQLILLGVHQLDQPVFSKSQMSCPPAPSRTRHSDSRSCINAQLCYLWRNAHIGKRGLHRPHQLSPFAQCNKLSFCTTQCGESLVCRSPADWKPSPRYQGPRNRFCSGWRVRRVTKHHQLQDRIFLAICIALSGHRVVSLAIIIAA